MVRSFHFIDWTEGSGHSPSLSAQCFVPQEFCLKHTAKHKLIPLQKPIISLSHVHSVE